MTASAIQVMANAASLIESEQYDRANEILLERLQQSATGIPSDERAALHSLVATSLGESGQIAEALNHAQQSLALHQELGDLQNVAHTRFQTGALQRILGAPDEAKQTLLQAIAESEQAQSGVTLVMAQMELARVYSELKEPVNAKRLFAEAASTSAAIGDIELAQVIQENIHQIDMVLSMNNLVQEQINRDLVDSIASGDSDRAYEGVIRAANMNLSAGNAVGSATALQLLLDVLTSDVEEEKRNRVQEILDLMEAGDRYRAALLMNETLAQYSDREDDFEQSLGYLFTQSRMAIKRQPLQFQTDTFQQFLKRAIEEEDEFIESQARLELGQIASVQGNYGVAIQETERALTILERQGHTRFVVSVHLEFGRILEDAGDRELAMEQYREALQKAREVAVPFLECRSLLSLSHALLQSDRLAEAKESLRRALGIARQNGLQDLIARALVGLGNIDAKAGDIRAGLTKLNNAAKIAKDNNLVREAAEVYGSLADLSSQSGDYAAGHRFGKESVQYWRQIGDMDAIASGTRDLATLSQGMGRYDVAIEEAIDALRLYQELGNTTQEAVCYFQIGSNYRDKAELVTAFAFMAIACWLDEQARSEFTFLHETTAERLARTNGLEPEWRTLRRGASQSYGSDRGKSLIKRITDR